MAKRFGSPSAPSTLEPRLGVLDAAAIVVSNVIGGGIFFVPQIVAAIAPHPFALLGVWLLGGLLSFAGAMAYAELAAARPRAGAEYVYLRDAFGRLPAFLTGWTSFVAGFSGAIAASAVALAEYVGRFVPAAGDATPLVTLPLVPLVVSRKALVALAAIAALSFVHVRGLGPGRLVQNTLAGLKVSGLLLFVALGLSLGHGSPANFSTSAGPVTAAGVLLALVPVMFSYSGWNAAAYVAEEVREPARNVPLALALGTGTVTVIYLALNVLFLYATPVGELSVLRGGLIDRTCDRLFASGLGGWIAAFTIVSIAASISAMTIAGPRVYFAMARDGLFLGPAARVHPRFHTPALSIVAQAVWSGVLVLSGTLSQLLSYTGFAVVLFSGVAVASLFVLRRRDSASERPYSTWGYPVAPAVFVLASAVLVLNEIWSRPGPALAGLGVMAAGVPVFWWMRAEGARLRAEHPASGPEARGGVRERSLSTEVIHGE
jgi:basic amino acid/polyamine antiporter, APA family